MSPFACVLGCLPGQYRKRRQEMEGAGVLLGCRVLGLVFAPSTFFTLIPGGAEWVSTPLPSLVAYSSSIYLTAANTSSLPASLPQAMDRAHRLGQRRTVTVYRILTRDTLEERVMGLQQFKMDVAAAVVNADNVSMDSMDTASLLDVFGASAAGAVAASGSGSTAAASNLMLLPSEADMAEVATASVEGRKGKPAPKSGLAAALASMGEMWDESQYSKEFSMDCFMQKIGGTAQGGNVGKSGGKSTTGGGRGRGKPDR